MRAAWIALAVWGLATGQEPAQEAPPIPVASSPGFLAGEYLDRPNWVHAPTMKDLAALYPDQARQAQVNGRVVVDCQFTPEGWLTNCVVSSEAPPGYGFARATLQALRSFQAAPTVQGGLPASRFRVLLRVNWTPPSPGSAGPSYETVAVSPPPPPAAIAPDWERTPTADEFGALYPREAMAKGVVGETLMKCMVTRDGLLTGCAIIRETPPDMGFGAATLATVRYFKMKPRTAGGAPVEGGIVYIPLKWRLG